MWECSCRSAGKFHLPAFPEPGPIPTQPFPGQVTQGGTQNAQLNLSQIVTSPVLPSMAAQLAGATPAGVAFLLKLHLDQSDQRIGIMLSQQKICELMDAWRVRDNDGEEPSIGSEASPHQISALHARLVGGG